MVSVELEQRRRQFHCLQCGARPGEPCWTKSGAKAAYSHADRRRQEMKERTS